jgi:catechol 2,3-dioxygenase-like lactoylglutathione lyase family enzyme
MRATAALAVTTPAVAQSAPLINRIRIATLNVPDMKSVSDWYKTWFDYVVADEGRIDAGLAQSWGAAGMTGKPFTLLSSKGSPDVHIRVVQGDPAPVFNPRTTYGWGSLEFIVSDLDALHKKLKAGGIGIFREPASLGGLFASIHAMQIYGPMNMSHNLAVDTGDPAKSNLPVAKSLADRIFLIGVNGPSLKALSDFYVQTFQMSKGPDYDYPIPVLAEALNMPKDHKFALTLVRSAQKGNTIELHDLPPPGGPRAQVPGQLPPGVGVVSFGVKNLDAVKADYLTPPALRAGKAYNGRRAATMKGAAGELIELIEE